MSSSVMKAAIEATNCIRDAKGLADNAIESVGRIIELAGSKNSNSTDTVERLFDHAINHPRLSGYVVISCDAAGRYSVSSPFHGLCFASQFLGAAIVGFVGLLRVNGYATNAEASKILNG